MTLLGTLEEAIAAQGIFVHVTVIKADRQGDVIADEASIVQLLLDKSTGSHCCRVRNDS
jgi:hypothetical protein